MADLEALPKNVKGEIIEGVLYAMTRPRSPHQRNIFSISAEIFDPFDRGLGGPGGWWILPEPGIELPNTPEISPDVAGWRKERLPALPPDQSITVVPDWVCEILSPTTRRHNLFIKMPYYAKIGVQHLWMVDLEHRTLTIYQNDQGWRVVGTYGDETDARIEPFEAAAINIAAWWL